MCACDRALKRWTSGSSEWESPPARSAAEPRTMLSGWGSTWPTYCWAKEPRRSWRWPGSSTMPDNPTRLRDRAPEVNGSLSAVSHSLVSSKTWIPFFCVPHLMLLEQYYLEQGCAQCGATLLDCSESLLSVTLGLGSGSSLFFHTVPHATISLANTKWPSNIVIITQHH